MNSKFFEADSGLIRIQAGFTVSELLGNHEKQNEGIINRFYSSPPLSFVIVFSILDEVLYTGLIERKELDAQGIGSLYLRKLIWFTGSYLRKDAEHFQRPQLLKSLSV